MERTREEKIKRKFIGAHVSTVGGPFNAPKNAKEIGARAFGMFVKNQRRWEAKPLTAEDIEKFKYYFDAPNFNLTVVEKIFNYVTENADDLTIEEKTLPWKNR